MLLTAIVAVVVAAVATPVVRSAMRRWNVLDHPNHRSLHVDPTPRGGGIAVTVAVLAAVALAPQLGRDAKVAFFVAGGGFALVGLAEDIIGIPAVRRLAVMFAVAALPLPWLLSDLAGTAAWRVAFTLAVVFWIVSYVNAFNFMDGINGLAAGQATVAGLAWFIVGQARDLPALATAGLALAGAAIGFGIYNYPRGTVFLGDVGSYFLGAVVGSVAVFGLRSGLPPETVLAPLALFAADTGFTLARRIASGERWHEAHCDHAYQRLTRRFQGSHARTTALVVMLMAIVAALGDLSLAGSTPLRIAGDAGIVVVLATYVSAAALSVRTRGREPAFA